MKKMAKRTYDEKYQQVQIWIDITNHYWHVHQGILKGKDDFWNDTLHSMQEQDFWDMVDICEVLILQYPEKFGQLYKVKEHLTTIKKRLHQGKPVIKQWAVSWNNPAFHTLMEIKDVLNDLGGTPTKQFPKIKDADKDPDQPLTPYQKRQSRKENNITIQETLFEITD
jgi:hypothetical protein